MHHLPSCILCQDKLVAYDVKSPFEPVPFTFADTYWWWNCRSCERARQASLLPMLRREEAKLTDSLIVSVPSLLQAFRDILPLWSTTWLGSNLGQQFSPIVPCKWFRPAWIDGKCKGHMVCGSLLTLTSRIWHASMNEPLSHKNSGLISSYFHSRLFTYPQHSILPSGYA